jgi:hypothetical protein
MAIRWRPVKVNITSRCGHDGALSLGRGIVRDIVWPSDTESGALCYVIQGVLVRTDRIRIIRGGMRVHSSSGDRAELRAMTAAGPGQQVVKVSKGCECCLRIRGFEVRTGDVVEAFRGPED